MRLSLSLQTLLLQTLTPQQIQYLKLLQLPVLQLEQHIRQEIEENPMLEEIAELDEEAADTGDEFDDAAAPVGVEEYFLSNLIKTTTPNSPIWAILKDPFEFYEAAWQDNLPPSARQDDDDGVRAAN